MTPAGAEPARVAIVGAGPSGFYAAAQLLAADPPVAVDLYDRLPTPWGLVRAGVAPDHPKIKSVTRVYERTAGLAGFRFVGNTRVGSDVHHDELLAHYHAVLYATGAAHERELGIPGEDLDGHHASGEFVAWYNGHPDLCDARFDLSGRRAVVIGNGNVALDVARMLVLSRDALAATDMADHAIDALGASGIEEVVVLGRRGPAEAAFTTPELRELTEIPGVQLHVEPGSLIDVASVGEPSPGDKLEILRRHVGVPAQPGRRIVLRFLASPLELVGDDRVRAVRIGLNELVVDERGAIVARPTGESELLEADLVIRAIGYRAAPIHGVPFDEVAGIVHHGGGRVLDPTGGRPLPGVYAAGWVKRGPSGVIGTNKKCAQETVAALLEDLAAGRASQPSATPDALLVTLRGRGARIVGYDGWEAIDAAERAAGEAQGRPRVKLVRHEHLLAAAQATTGGAGA